MMDNKKIRAVGAGILVALWLILTAAAWFSPAKEISQAERRPLKQLPEITLQSVLGGKFMKNFEDYTLDQFPLRDSFRELKSLMHYYVLGQKDNNGIYLADGYAAKLEYPLKPRELEHALGKFQFVYDKYLKDTGSRIFSAVIPDKGYYLAEENGFPAMDYEALFEIVRQGMPWAEHITLTDLLSLEDYYRTDTHWRQEQILDVAGRLAEAMSAMEPEPQEFQTEAAEQPFYGVYHGQAALPMKPETLYYLESDWLDSCTVTNFENGKTGSVYDLEKLGGKDPYEVYLSGPVSLLQIENPSATSDRELIIFRDSFGSSVAPLLLKEYKTVTLVDIRYLSSMMLGNFLDFHGQDVLFLYSTLVLNNGSTLK